MDNSFMPPADLSGWGHKDFNAWLDSISKPPIRRRLLQNYCAKWFRTSKKLLNVLDMYLHNLYSRPHQVNVFLYAGLQTWHVMVWWYMSVSSSWSPGLHPSVRLIRPPPIFSYMFLHIELKFGIWLSFTVLQIKFECRQFAYFFLGVMPF